MTLPVTQVQGGTLVLNGDPDLTPRSIQDIKAQFNFPMSIRFDTPLAEDIEQAFIPVIEDDGRIIGFLPISPANTFTAGDASYPFTLEGNDYTLQVVTLPALGTSSTVDAESANSDYRGRGIAPTYGNREDLQRLDQYVALVLNDVDVRLSERNQVMPQGYVYPTGWINYRAFGTLVNAGNPVELGYYSFWSMPVQYVIHHFQRGTYLDGLRLNMNVTPTPITPVPPPPGSNSTITWATTMAPDFGEECEFFDFNWIAQFVTSPYVENLGGQTNVVPVTITVNSNPAGGQFKAMVLQTQGAAIYPNGSQTFDTIRIVKLEDAPAGDYVFNFTISYANAAVATDSTDTNGTVAVTLTLTIV